MSERKVLFQLEIDLDDPPGPKEIWQKYLEAMLDAYDGKVSRTAAKLGISRTTLYRRRVVDLARKKAL